MISTMGGLLVGDHLTWRHWTEDVLLALHLEDVVVRSAVVDDSSIELPWPSKEKMTNGHWDDVALQGVFIGADFEGDLYSVLDLDDAGVTKPLHFVWMWMLHLGQLDLGAKFFTREIMTTSAIDDDLDGSSIDAGLGVEYGASLVFFLAMLEGQDFGDNKCGPRVFITKDLFFFIVHLAVHGDLLKCFHFAFTHGVISALVVEDHGWLVGALIGLVALASASETLEGTRLDGLIGWG